MQDSAWKAILSVPCACDHVWKRILFPFLTRFWVWAAWSSHPITVRLLCLPWCPLLWVLKLASIVLVRNIWWQWQFMGLNSVYFSLVNIPKKALHDSIISEVSPNKFLTVDYTLSYKLEYWQQVLLSGSLKWCHNGPYKFALKMVNFWTMIFCNNSDQK